MSRTLLLSSCCCCLVCWCFIVYNMLVIAMRCLDTKRDRVKRAVRTVEREACEWPTWGMRTRRQTPTDLIYCVTTSRRRKTTPTHPTTRRVLLEWLCQLFGLLLADLYFVVYFYRACVCLSVCHSPVLYLNGVQPFMDSLKPHSNGPLYSNTVIGTLAVDGWAVTFGTARTGLGGLRPRPVPSSLYQM